MFERMARQPTLQKGPGLPIVLRVRFVEGERPYRFWVSGWSPGDRGPVRYKILSKRLAGQAIEALVVEEQSQGGRTSIGRVEVPPEVPSGWLQRWVDTLAAELGVRFESVDLTGLETPEAWLERARRLGWSGADPR